MNKSLPSGPVIGLIVMKTSLSMDTGTRVCLCIVVVIIDNAGP